jgi:hypothetical protein
MSIEYYRNCNYTVLTYLRQPNLDGCNSIYMITAYLLRDVLSWNNQDR